MTGQDDPIHRQPPIGAVAQWKSSPEDNRPRRIEAVGDAVPRLGESVSPTDQPCRHGSGDTRLDRDGILEGSRPGFLGRLAPFYAILAGRRNCPGVTPTRRLK